MSSNRVCECRNPDWQPCSDCPRHDATRNRVRTEAEFLEHVRMELCSILSAVNGIRTEDARTLVIELRDEVEARLG